MWAYTAVPAYLYSGLSPLSAQLGSASEVVPRFVETAMGVQRAALVLLATAFVSVAAVVHPRADGVAAAPYVAIGAVLAGIAVLGIGWATLQGVNDVRIRDQWRVAHSDAGEGLTARPDVEMISGSIVIVPGDWLEIDVWMALASSADLTRLIFSLNPGMRIDHLAVEGRPVPFSHEDGLLTLDLPARANGGTTVTLRAGGIPDERFAYLDSAVDWRRRPPTNHLPLLGTESALFIAGSWP